MICTDGRYLKAEGLSLAITKGCVPVDGDTYDVPAIITTAEARWKAHDLPKAKFGHREKSGLDPKKHRDFFAVTHVAKVKGVLKEVGLPATVFAARESTHSKINADIGKPDYPTTKVLFEFLEKTVKK